jgi:hypothetical protein
VVEYFRQNSQSQISHELLMRMITKY